MPLSRIKTTSITDDSVTNTKLADTTVTAGSYVSASSVPVLTVDAQGRLTSASAAAVAGGQFVDTQTVKAVYYNHNAITANITVAATRNAFSAGPITVSSGVNVTIAVGATYTII